jgi:hypothetical protein
MRLLIPIGKTIYAIGKFLFGSKIQAVLSAIFAQQSIKN